MQSTFTMRNKKLLLIFKDDRGFLTPKKSFSMEELELDSVINKKVIGPIAWELQVLRLNETTGKLTAEISKYTSPLKEFPEEQLALSTELEKVSTLYFRFVKTTSAQSSLNDGTEYRNPIAGKLYPKSNRNANSGKRNTVIDKSFKVPLDKVSFIEGGVEWINTFPQSHQPVRLFIPNEHIRSDFDAVKNYIARVLKKKKLTINVKAEVNDGTWTTLEIASPEVDLIDGEIMDKVKFEVYRNFPDISSIANEPEIIDEDDLVARLNEDQALFEQEDILGQIITLAKPLHYQHLAHLSELNSLGKTKLAYVTEPRSFIFTIIDSNNKKLHFVWETSDTKEATYVWTSDLLPNTDVLHSRRMIKNKIGEILKIGKSSYIKKQEKGFHRIIHDYDQEKSGSGIELWKTELGKVLG